MNIGIIGAGNMGGVLAERWANCGHTVCLSFSRSPQKLQAAAQSAGPNAFVGSPTEAVRFGKILVIAVPCVTLHGALDAAGPIEDKDVIVCTLSRTNPCFPLVPDTALSCPEEIARRLPASRIVVAFNTIFADVLRLPAPGFKAGPPTAFYCGDDPYAKARVRPLMEDLGLQPLDIGTLASAGYLDCLGTFLMHLRAVGFGTQVAMHLLRSVEPPRTRQAVGRGTVAL